MAHLQVNTHQNFSAEKKTYNKLEEKWSLLQDKCIAFDCWNWNTSCQNSRPSIQLWTPKRMTL